MFKPARLATGLCLGVVLTAAAHAESHLMRFADVRGDQIVFTYEDDLWLVSSAGGEAHRITRDAGAETYAKFSPDGKWIAFTGQYDGGSDVYLMPAQGGIPKRLTYHPAADRVLGWFPDGQSVLFRSRREYPFRGEQVYRVSTDGGMAEKLPVDRAGLASLSPDGQMIAYNRITREDATWKRHVGGDSQKLWLGSLEKMDYRVIADSEWTSNYPMWHGDAVYFTSDRQYGTLNIYKYDVKTGNVAAMTSYKDYDVKYPSLGDSQIIYQYAESLYLLDLKTGKSRIVPVEIPSDLVRMRPERVAVSPSTGTFGLSPAGKRLLLVGRGEVLNYPVEDGEPINLTKTSGSREKNAAWSPDGRWIAFVSDKTGEEEIYLVDQKGEKDWRQLTHGGLGLRMQLVWSPDSKHLLFADKFMRLNLVDAGTGDITAVDRAGYDDGWERWGIQDYVWSPDSQWIAYTKLEQSLYESIFLYSLEAKKSFRITSDLTEDWSPSFDPQGRYLYLLSNRTFDPVMCFVDQNHMFLNMGRPYVVILKEGDRSPFYPKDSEEAAKEPEPTSETSAKSDAQPPDTTAQDKPDAKGKEKGEEKKKAQIDLEGIERRIIAAAGVPAGNYFRLEATQDGFLYLRKNQNEFEKYQTVTDNTGGALDLYHYTLEKQEAKRLVSGIANYHRSADGKKLVYRAGSSYGVVDVGKEAKVGDGRVELGGLRIDVVRQQEFLQMLDEAWRIERDWFYDPNMHGVNWPALREQYRKFVPFCGNRSDLNYLIGEMIAELNIGHTHVSGGDSEGGARRVSTGLLGADFKVEPGAPFYRIAHIIPGTAGDESARSPLTEPGCPIQEGHYLIAINGEEVRTTDDVYAHLQGKPDAVVTLTYNDQPSADGAKTFRVRTIGSEAAIRYREWVDRNRAYVDKATDGQVGYLHIPDMGAGGLIELAKVFYPLHYKRAFVIDARYNGGGFTGDMIIDRLERRAWGLTKPREGGVLVNPERAFHGHLVVLINEDTSSNAEMFAEAVKIRKLAPVIGMRTWGGAIGIEPHQDLVDGGSVTPPQFGLYGLNRQWLIEGRGVDPDIEVQNMPGDVLRGKDAQLDAAIANVLKRLADDPLELPPVPTYPDKSKK